MGGGTRWKDLQGWSALSVVLYIAGTIYWLVKGLTSGAPLWVKALLLIGGIAALIFMGFVIYWGARDTFAAGGTIRLEDGSLVFTIPSWAHKWIVPVSRVRLIAIDESPDRRRRFRVSGAKDDRAGWLWRRSGGALPYRSLNGSLRTTPNVAFVFDPPVEIGGTKSLRTFLLFPASFLADRVRVATAHVEDLAKARAFFEDLGLVRAPMVVDVEAVAETEEEAARRRRFDRIALSLFGLMWAGLLAYVIWSIASGS